MRDSKRDTDVKNVILDSVGEGEGGMIWNMNYWHMYIIICEIDSQPRFNAWDRVLRAGALGWLWEMGWGGRWEGGSGWGTHVHPWLIHVNVWQKPPQYCKVISLQLKIFLKRKKNSMKSSELGMKWYDFHHIALEDKLENSVCGMLPSVWQNWERGSIKR